MRSVGIAFSGQNNGVQLRYDIISERRWVIWNYTVVRVNRHF